MSKRMIAAGKVKGTKTVHTQIEHNKRRGLLCACNGTLIPYYDDEGNEHGEKKIGNIVHGYDDCYEIKEN